MLKAARLTCQRGDAVLFRELGFELAAGEALLVRGANGSGKTSLLRIVAGVAAPAEGEILWRDSNDRDARQRDTAYQGHTAPLKDELSVIENLEFALALDGCSVERANLLDTIKAVGLAARRNLPVRHLSQGQRRRVGLARLMLARRPLWLLDEPATALDAAGLTLFCEVLDRHLADGGLAMLSTHQSLPLAHPTRELSL